MLRSAQNRRRRDALFHMRMMGFMHRKSEAPGDWNPTVRPLKAPMPTWAIRNMVEQDAPFLVKYNPHWLTYLLRCRLKGAKRLIAALRRRSPIHT